MFCPSYRLFYCLENHPTVTLTIPLGDFKSIFWCLYQAKKFIVSPDVNKTKIVAEMSVPFSSKLVNRLKVAFQYTIEPGTEFTVGPSNGVPCARVCKFCQVSPLLFYLPVLSANLNSKL